MADGPREWYASIPPITKVWLTGALAAAVGVKVGAISSAWFLFDWRLVAYKFQIYRLVLPFFFFGRLSFNTLFALSWLYNYGKAYELSAYPSGGGPGYGNTADYLYSLFLGGTLLLLLSATIHFTALGEALNMFVIYLWAKRHPEEQASIWFFKFPGLYLPWALVAFSFALDQDPVPGLAGIAVAHLYYYILDVLPRTDGPLRVANTYLQTPNALYRLFSLGPTGVAAMVQGGAGRRAGVPPVAPGFHAWGGGQVLGAGGRGGGGGGAQRPHAD